jgi:lysozyme family protein
MAELRLPRFLTDRNAENRENAIIRFAEENNDILKKQVTIMTAMAKSLQHIEDMIFLQLDYEKRKIALQMQDMQRTELEDIESRREQANARNATRPTSGGSLAGAAAKLGLKGLLGAFLFGFGMELIGWGKTLNEWRMKLIDTLGGIQETLDKWGDKLEEITGSKVLGGIVRSLLVIGTALGSIRVLFGPRAFAPIRAVFSFLGDLFKLAQNSKFVTNSKVLTGAFKFFEAIIKPFAAIGRMLGFVGEGGALMKTIGGLGKFLGVLGKIAGPIGILISVVQGIWGAFKGFQEGFEKGGFLEGLKEGFIGLIDGLVGGIVDMFADLLGWILKQLGFEELGQKFSEFNFKDFFGTIVDQVIYGVELLIHYLMKGVDAYKSMLATGLETLTSLFPDWLKEKLGIGPALNWLRTPSAGEKPTAPAVRTAGADAERAEAAAAATPAPPPPITQQRRPTATPTVPARAETSDLGAPASATGSMTQGMVGSAQVGTGGGMSFEQSVAQVLRHEGGYVNDPNDPGGETKYGISKKAYPNVDIKNLTIDGAKAIYKRDYWDAINADSLPPAVRYAAFDTAVNMGVGIARRFVQESGGDLNKFSELRRARYAMLIQRNPRLAKFQRGWNNRVNDVARMSVGAGPQVPAASSAPMVASAPSASSGSSLASAQSAVTTAAAASSGPSVASLNNSRTNVTNNTTNQQGNISASTPVEFAPHVV